MKNTILKLIESWRLKDGNVNLIKDIIEWINISNKNIGVNIEKCSLADSSFWFYSREEGAITNKNNSFFQVKGLKKYDGDKLLYEQPIIIQKEIGYLGIICKEINGVLNFLMQAKIEPGNINKIQISPTIQATKSNFTQKHGGGRPAYLEYFINASKHEVVVDQIQSEQSSRFYKKRNRNIIIKIDEDIDVLPSHKWMTLGQIKELMKIDNIVNMDTRTVLSCIPFSLYDFDEKELLNIKEYFTDETLFNSIFKSCEDSSLQNIYQYINNYKMFNNNEIEIVPLESINSWKMKNNEFVCDGAYDFKVIFCNISIDGREVKEWTQPLFEANGLATFGLMVCNDNGVKKFLVRAMPEVGCFDEMELGPTVQIEHTFNKENGDNILELFLEKLNANEGIKYNVILSEEGGRFYHEQNHNIIIEVEKEEVEYIPEGYFWVDYKTLNILTQVNNCLNIQLRNLISLLEV